MRRVHSALVLLLAAAGVAGCRRHDDPRFSVRSASDSQPLGPGDLRIYNADTSVELTLMGDHISTGLSERVLAKVRREAEDSTDADSGIGGAIASLVKKTVAGAIGSRFEFPLEDVRDVHYEDGALVFDWKDGHPRNLFSNHRGNGEQTDKRFEQADAERFIAAVRARKRELGQE